MVGGETSEKFNFHIYMVVLESLGVCGREMGGKGREEGERKRKGKEGKCFNVTCEQLP